MLISLNLEYLMKEYPDKPFHVYLCQMDAALCERVIEDEPPPSLLESLPDIFMEINDLLVPNFIDKDTTFIRFGYDEGCLFDKHIVDKKFDSNDKDETNHYFINKNKLVKLKNGKTLT